MSTPKWRERRRGRTAGNGREPEARPQRNLEQHLVEPADPRKVASWKIFGWIALTLGLLMVGLILYAAMFGYR